MLKGKIALVTGGARGIGKEIALKFAENGATVISGDLIDADYTHVNVSHIKLNVTDRENIKEVAKELKEKYGKIDILVNNAGICNLSQPFENIDVEKWDQVMDVNLKGILYCVKAVIPIFKKQKSGKIINVASLAGEVGGIATSADYVASKAAVIGLTKSLARYLGPYNVNVNAVAPGFIATEMTEEMSIPMNVIPLGCVGRPEDVADGITFLASERARYITGTTLDINGGVFMK